MTNAVCDFDAPVSSARGRASALYDLAGLAVRPFATIAGFYRRRAVLAKLASLDDHMLCDIGLQRFDIADAATLSSGEDVTRFLRGRANERRRAENPISYSGLRLRG
ncbi:MAG: DUF1127 domain-containing protein [Tepidamorphaceae bacterium]|nr:DUF1127 domain-containing protein [Rhodobiaceae bacterium]MCC0048980.1 DUF1127 domain-containing protein [Rhodobiaceae bacterium]